MASELLDTWNERYGSLDDFSKSTNPPAPGFKWQTDTAYPVRIKSARVIKSARGDVQVEMSLAILVDDVETATAREWLTLPKQENDLKLAPETVTKLTRRRRDDLIRVLGNVNRQAYRLYRERKKNAANKWTYFDFNGNEMGTADFDARQVEINKAAMKLADELHEKISESLEDWADAEFYVVKVPNPRYAKFPYTNFYGDRPDKIPLHGEPDSVPF